MAPPRTRRGPPPQRPHGVPTSPAAPGLSKDAVDVHRGGREGAGTSYGAAGRPTNAAGPAGEVSAGKPFTPVQRAGTVISHPPHKMHHGGVVEGLKGCLGRSGDGGLGAGKAPINRVENTTNLGKSAHKVLDEVSLRNSESGTPLLGSRMVVGRSRDTPTDSGRADDAPSSLRHGVAQGIAAQNLQNMSAY